MHRPFRFCLVTLLAVCGAWTILRAQKPFREYPGREYENFPLPEDWQKSAEWTRARLRVPGVSRGFFRGGGDSNWTTDYPRSDRHLLQGIRRLTRIDTRSVEQVVDLDGSDDVFNWPAMYAVEVGHWRIPPDQAKQLRDFLLRGGFLMVDDFHGSYEWQVFLEGIKNVFPDRAIEDIPDSDPIFHTSYDLEQRFQVPGAQYLRSGRTYEQDGYTAQWRGIYDDKGRLMVAICFNMDLGDAWEHADVPEYALQYTTRAYKYAINYILYAMTH